MSELQPTFVFDLDGDDSVAEQLVNLEAAFDQLKADGLIHDYTLLEAE